MVLNRFCGPLKTFSGLDPQAKWVQRSAGFFILLIATQMASKIFIDGEAGTTGLQIRDRLAGRADLELLSIDPAQRKDLDARASLLRAADIAILCLPDDAARQSVELIGDADTRVIDASTAHRVQPEWVYGFAEMDADQAGKIASVQFVANPGCWPQGVIATMRPLVKASLYDDDGFEEPLVVSGISGYSGGGRQMIEAYEAAGDGASEFAPYALKFEHKHLPEMQAYCGYDRRPTFLPSVGNFAQGMLELIRVPLSPKLPTMRDVHEILSAHYAEMENSFVSVASYEETNKPDGLDPQVLNDTNQMRLHVVGRADGSEIVVAAIYDNLGKGASGSAVQNLNLMLGVAPDTGLV